MNTAEVASALQAIDPSYCDDAGERIPLLAELSGIYETNGVVLGDSSSFGGDFGGLCGRSLM
jgi:hypothetical protein